MLDAQPLATLAAGVLTLNATDGNDSYLVSRIGAGGGGDIVKIKEVLTGVEETFGTAGAGVTSIVADGKKGDDNFDFSGAGAAVTVPISVIGGDGNNSLTAPGTSHTWNITGAGSGTVG